MDERIRVTNRSWIDPAELSWQFSRSSGPGGQGVNTTDSRAQVSLDVGTASGFTDSQRSLLRERLSGRLVDDVLTVTAQDERSQYRNRKLAVQRLVALLAEGLAPPPKKRRPTKPGKAAKARRLDAKKRRGQTKALRQRPGSDA